MPTILNIAIAPRRLCNGTAHNHTRRFVLKSELHGALALALAWIWLGQASSVQAQPSAHYPAGAEGLFAATLPPPGFYVRDYNVVYYADRLNDYNGKQIHGLDANALIYANAPRFAWITEQKLFGGYIGLDGFVALQYTQLSLKSGSTKLIDSSTVGLSDAFLEVNWSKHIQQFDFALAYGAYAPTGDSAPAPTTRAGLGYWTHVLTAGATWYPDHDKKWALSALNLYEFNMEKEETEITTGQVYTLEWGLSYALAKPLNVGLVGYYQQKVTEDSGSGASNQHDRVAAIGPEVSMLVPGAMMFSSLRYNYEFMAEGRLQGHNFVLTLTKRF